MLYFNNKTYRTKCYILISKHTSKHTTKCYILISKHTELNVIF